MRRVPTLRTAGLLAALLLTLAASGATWWRNARDGGAQAAVAAAPPAARDAGAPGRDAPSAQAAGEPAPAADAPPPDLFAPADWDTPPVAPAPPPAPPPPSAPALPFQYVGRTELADGRGHVLVHLRRGNELHSVQPGQHIDEHYRLEAVHPELLEIAYLPMNLKQTLQVGNR